MQKESFIHIAKRVAEGNATEEELSQYLHYLDWYAENNPEWDQVSPSEKSIIQANIRLSLAQKLSPPKTISLYRKYRWVLLAASLFLGAFSVMYTLKQFQPVNNDEKQNIASSKAPQIVAGQEKATLTLANGKKILLDSVDDVEQLSEAGVEIIKESGGQLTYKVIPGQNQEAGVNTLSTQRGETYSVVLLDGTKVWLNASSSLTFSTALYANGKRKVDLEGEAYFEVKEDKKHPFVVLSDGQEVTVLGTHFNINGYKDDGTIKTTLLEGSVRVTSHLDGSRSKSSEVVIKVGEQAVLSKKGIKVIQKEVDQVVDWKNGDFIFRRESLTEVMARISRWYNVQVVFDHNLNKSITFSGQMSRSRDLSDILKNLSGTGEIKFELENSTIKVLNAL
ncbi:FecR family protein [Pedobacter nyackensis]|uniref:FecR family protein n=1 Tax=Pedobacter nyackensis TaxID=475255 RepID=A0A1W2BCI4_9SPHI|nr:FecR family protein [Pedobacter nyackensis]SMC70616.1 FecR family protein [Pedobacter nyackensis]